MEQGGIQLVLISVHHNRTAGADASASLGWVINKLEGVGFEVKNIDVLGVHYAATIYRWVRALIISFV